MAKQIGLELVANYWLIMIENSGNTTEQSALESVLQRVLKNAAIALGGSGAVVATWDEISHSYTVNGSFGIDDKQLELLDPLLSEAIPDLAGSNQQFDVISSLDPTKSLPVSNQGKPEDQILALPLQSEGKVIGLIYILRQSSTARFTNLDPPVLDAFADQAAVAVQNARLAHSLSQEKLRLEAMVEGSADGIYTVDSERRIVGLNSAMESLLGRSRNEVVGLPCSRVLGLHDWQGNAVCPVNCPVLWTTNSEDSSVELQGRLESPDGNKTDVSVVYSLVHTPSGQVSNAVVTVRDITPIREMNHLRSVFLSMLGHELQTPLSIIKGYANTLARTEGSWDKDTLRNGVTIIEEESDRLSQIMNRLILASQLESGGTPFHKEPVDLESSAQRAVRRSEALTDNHTFTVEFPDCFPTAQADPAMIDEVMINLLDNAVKYSPDGGMISVTGAEQGLEIAVTVADHGQGLTMWESTRIFEQFRRGENPTVQASRGMGLGLYICNSIIVAHGGRIEVDSVVGEGSRFTFLLPI